MMPDLNKVIKDLEEIKEYIREKVHDIASRKCRMMDKVDNAIELLKEQEGYVSVPFSWLVKFCTHIDFKEPMSDKERELLWREKLNQQFGI